MNIKGGLLQYPHYFLISKRRSQEVDESGEIVNEIRGTFGAWGILDFSSGREYRPGGVALPTVSRSGTCTTAASHAIDEKDYLIYQGRLLEISGLVSRDTQFQVWAFSEVRR